MFNSQCQCIVSIDVGKGKTGSAEQELIDNVGMVAHGGKHQGCTAETTSKIEHKTHYISLTYYLPIEFPFKKNSMESYLSVLKIKGWHAILAFEHCHNDNLSILNVYAYSCA